MVDLSHVEQTLHTNLLLEALENVYFFAISVRSKCEANLSVKSPVHKKGTKVNLSFSCVTQNTRQMKYVLVQTQSTKSYRSPE